MKRTLAGDSPCPPWASFCPWNQLSWHVCAHSPCYLFPRVRYLICAPRAHALPRSAAVQARATKGLWGLPALVAVSVYQRPEPCLSKEMSSESFLSPYGDKFESVFGPSLFSLVIQYTNGVSFSVFVFCLEPSMLVSKYNRKTDGKL